MRNITIGTRGSDLAIKQTEIIKEEILKLDPSIKIDIKIIKTEGDKNMKSIPLDTVGKGWFTKEIECDLISKDIDLAVHSLKDLPEILPNGLHISAITARGDIRDVLVSKDGIKLKDFKKGSIIGTDSIRRKIQILSINPNVKVKSIRGNVNTRLNKLENDGYSGLVLAAAGLQRLGMENIITEYFDPDVVFPAPGQGALAVETRIEDEELNLLLSKINDRYTKLAVSAERSFALNIGGGCKFPIGGYAFVKDEKITLHGMLASLDGSEIVKDTITGSLDGAESIGKKLAESFLDRVNPESL